MNNYQSKISQIMTTQHQIGESNDYTYTYEWVDPTKRFSFLSKSILIDEMGLTPSIGQKITLGELRLQCIEDDIVGDYWVVQRVTKLSWFWYWKHRISNQWHKFTKRLLWTAVVWGLADRPMYGETISRSHLKAVKWWQNRRKSL